MKYFVLTLGLILSGTVGTDAQAITVSVPGTANPWLAGMGDGAVSSEDTAPAQTPILIDLSQFSGAHYLTFSAFGVTDNGGGQQFGSDGDTSGWVVAHTYGVENGIAASSLPFLSLSGVFLDDSQPNTSAAPTLLNYRELTTQFSSFSAQLKQPFFIGDGLTGTGIGDVQQFLIPLNATRLYLGTADGYGWNNNLGALTVAISAVPAPANAALMLAGLAVFGFLSVRKK
ncbi:MAG TPA: hypothetical protein VIZ65_13945 [Cellvibrionaceae bacterium]